MTVAPLLVLLGLYLALGVCFAVPIVMRGVKRIDPHAAHGTWGFRLMIFPGVVFLWPLLARRWLLGATHPPEERTAHRRRAGAPVSGPAHGVRVVCRIGDGRSKAG